MSFSILPFQIIYLTLLCVAYLANLLRGGGGYLNPPYNFVIFKDRDLKFGNNNHF